MYTISAEVIIANYFAEVAGSNELKLSTLAEIKIKIDKEFRDIFLFVDWQPRYYDSNIRGETARSEVIRYIHRNPVKRGLVASAGQYRWSSFNHYATGIRGVVEIESEWTARLRAQGRL